ncbi:hypothetical protein HDU97_005570 [Phlyctochytrium planicorne]|nr:hypothetical protein HDU97_005570 [Phlyctochytrium planicorne]
MVEKRKLSSTSDDAKGEDKSSKEPSQSNKKIATESSAASSNPLPPPLSQKANPFFNLFRKTSKDDDWEDWDDNATSKPSSTTATPLKKDTNPTASASAITSTDHSPSKDSVVEAVHKASLSSPLALKQEGSSSLNASQDSARATSAPTSEKKRKAEEDPATPPEQSKVGGLGRATSFSANSTPGNIFSVVTPSKSIFGGSLAGRGSSITSAGLSEVAFILYSRHNPVQNAKVKPTFNLSSGFAGNPPTFGSSSSGQGFSFAAAKAVGSFSDLLSTPTKNVNDAEKRDDGGTDEKENDDVAVAITGDAVPVETKTGEEDENNLFQARCKLFRMDSEQKWRERGAGTFKINASSANDSARLGTDARECFNKVLTINPGNSVAIVTLGFMHQNDGELDAAIECYHKAFSLNPEQPFATSLLEMALEESFQGSPRILKVLVQNSATVLTEEENEANGNLLIKWDAVEVRHPDEARDAEEIQQIGKKFINLKEIESNWSSPLLISLPTGSSRLARNCWKISTLTQMKFKLTASTLPGAHIGIPEVVGGHVLWLVAEGRQRGKELAVAREEHAEVARRRSWQEGWWHEEGWEEWQKEKEEGSREL